MTVERSTWLVFNVRQSYCGRYSYRLDVCLSVRLSVTRWYCVETVQPIVKSSSLPGSPMILVFCGPIFPGIPMGTPQRGR